jgi:5,10-methylenetetrahydrofolate reductase
MLLILTLLGLSLIGVNEILAITGDPSKVGHLPGATNVYDVNLIYEH